MARDSIAQGPAEGRTGRFREELAGAPGLARANGLEPGVTATTARAERNRCAVARSGSATIGMSDAKELVVTTRAIHVPYTVEQDEDGVWCAHAQLRPGVGANGEGVTASAAIADLREALAGLIGEFGVPDELTLTIDVA